MARRSRKTQISGTSAVDSSVRSWKTAFYVRLSVEDNGKDSDSIENQIAVLETYIAARPYLNKVDIFVDNGYTGTDFFRPEFIRMMEAVQRGDVDCVLVKDLSRLGRNYIETSQFIEKICPFYGLRFISVNDRYDTAAVTGEGQLWASLSNIVNDYYAKDISRKVSSALQMKMERGDYIGSYAPYGYQKDPQNRNRLLVCPETAPVIRRIFQWRAEGMSYMGINRRLNDAGIPSPGQYKLNHGTLTNNNQTGRRILWNKHIITEILSDVIYIGHTAQRKGHQSLYEGIPFYRADRGEWIVVENTHEPLVSEELFEQVQQINQRSRMTAKANQGKYAHLPKAVNIYGRKLTCGGCGRVMKLHRSFNRRRDKAYFTFKCPTYAEHGERGCSDVKMRKAELDNAVFAFIKTQMDIFLDMEQSLRQFLSIKRAKPNQKGHQQELKELRQQLERKKSIFSRLYMDLKEGLLSQEEYRHHRAILTEDISALEARLSELEMIKAESEEQITGEMKWKFMVQRFYGADQISAEMVEAFVESITLEKDGTLNIKLSYMDEFEKLYAANEKLREEVA